MSTSEYIEESVQVGRFTAEVVYDEWGHAHNPREDGDYHAAEISMTMRSYDLPNELDIPFGELDTIADVEAWVRRELGRDLAWMGRIVGHSHGTTTFRVGTGHDRWDGGYAGVVTVRKSRIREQQGVKRVTAKMLEDYATWAAAEVDRYSEWGAGEVYFWRVRDEDGETVESCHGYIGHDDMKYALSEAVAEAQALEADAVEADREAAETAREIDAVARRVTFVPVLDNLGVAV